MARRRGSGRGRSAVNSRKSALENAREKLKDDPGGTRGQHNHNSNMEAAAATTTTAQATTKHLGGKNKQLLNNHHRSLDRRSVNSNNSSSNSNNNATAASASAGSSSSNSAAHRKHNNTNSLQQTYRVSGETHGGNGGGGSAVGAGAGAGAEKAPKQTAKQAKAAAKAAAAAAVAVAAAESEKASAAADPLAIGAAAKKSKQLPAGKREKAAAAGSGNVASSGSSSSDSSNSSSKNYSLSISDSCKNNNNNNNNSNTNNNNTNNNNTNNNNKNKSSSSNSSNISSTVGNSNKSDTTGSPAPESAAVAAAAAKPPTSDAAGDASATWNNSKYLHKKFKRLASTTETDAGAEGGDGAGKARSSSSSSSSSTTPPPAAPAPAPAPAASAPATAAGATPAATTLPATSSASEDRAMAGLTNGHRSPEQEQPKPQTQPPVGDRSVGPTSATTAAPSSTTMTTTVKSANTIAAHGSAIDNKLVVAAAPPTSAAIGHSSNSGNGGSNIKYNSSANSSNNLVPRTLSDSPSTATVISSHQQQPASINHAQQQTQTQVQQQHQHQQHGAEQQQQKQPHSQHLQHLQQRPGSPLALLSSAASPSPLQQQQTPGCAESAAGMLANQAQAGSPAIGGDQGGNIAGRHVCPYCNLNCTKPSVLQKHIRAHTNERPYPCDICGFAFKTKSNYYKHCRSRSHAARKRGIELPADADDGSFADSDQEQDPDLSNSSSDMISRTASPIDESSISSPAMPYQQLQYLQQQQAQQQLPLQQLSPGNVASPTPSPSSLSSTKSTYLQQPVGQQQQHQQLPLGSPAAGTLPPTTASVIGSSNAVAGVTPGGQKPVQTQTQAQAQSQIDYKPYKPKFHNAALYASTKAKDEAAARHHQLQQQPHHQPLEQQKPPNSVHHHLQQQQPHPQQAPPAQQPQPPPQAQPQPTHHPTLSPSTQVKLNNHINTHQLQLQLQQQQQQQLTINPANPAALPIASSPLAAVAAAAGVYYLAQPQTAAGAAAAPLLHPAAHMPQQYYNSVAAAAAAAHQQAFQAFQLMTPQQQQQFHHQLQLQQQHLQQQQQLQLQQQQHQHQQQQQQPQHSPALMKGHHRHQASSSIQATAAQALAQQQQQTSLQYLANAATAVSASTSSASGNGSSNSTTSSASTATTSGLIHGNISAVAAAASSGVVQLNKEFLTEHITKLISQNEAIVENKELLLQKKYPKTLNRSRSFNNANSNNNNNSSSHNASSSGAAHNHSNNSSGGGSSSASNNNLVISTTIESANAKLAQAIANKQQQQQLQQQQQQLQQQQQQHYQQMQQQMLQHPPLNGISKHIAASKQIAQPPAQQLQQPHHPLKQQQLPPQPTQQYRQPQPQPQPALQQQHQHQQQQQLLLQHQQQQQQQGPMTLLLQAQHQQKEIESLAHLPPSGNVPLNLSAKSKSKDDDAHHALPSSAVAAAAPGPATPAAAPVPAPATPRKRQSSELADRSVPSSEAPASAGSSVVVAAAAGSKHPPNNSIIKNLLLNARGMAVPTGEGEDAVYICPLCSLEFRTAEDLQLHNSTYCQGASSSAPISPVSSPSYKYFRSNSISLNFPELKNSIYLSKNPLSLAKLAWSQLKTKPSSLVLSRLSASQAGTTKSSAPAAPAAGGSSAGGGASTSAAAALDSTLRLIDAPLQSPGPLLGKTPLVDSYNHSEASRKSEDVVITKMHEDRQFSAAEAKRPKLDPGSSDQFQLHAAPGKQAAVAAAAAATGPRAAHGNSSGSAGNNISGGDMQLLATAASNLSADLSGSRKNEERMKRYNSSGGCMIPISECSDIDMSPKMIRTPLLSGGSFQEVSPKPKEKEPKVVLPMAGAGAQLTPKHGIAGLNLASTGPQHFQFPPINSITAFNPLTLPPMSSATMTLGEKVIPYVPGIPGPNSLTPQLPPQHLQVPAASGPNPSRGDRRALSPNRKKAASPMSTLTIAADVRTLSPFGGVQNAPSEFSRLPPSPALRAARNWSGINQAAAGITKQSATLSSLEVPKKSFNFQRIADNLSPRKSAGAAATASQTAVPKTSPPTKEVRHFNFDNISKETEIIVATSSVAGRGAPSSALTPLHVDTSAANATANPAPAAASTSSASSTTAGADMETSAGADVKKSKFLRPTSLPLKPGTFTPKRHHGITPTANTLPLISPETPRPSKACVQLYLNGHAYTYLGLKSSTKVFYCTVNLPQPSYVAGMHKLSMYSVWQVCAENNPHSLGLKPKVVMSLYDSRQKSITSTMAGANKLAYALVTSQHAVMTPFANNPGQFYHHQLKQIAADPANSSSNADGLLLSKEEGLTIDVNGEPVGKLDPSSSATSTGSASSQQMLVGGYESHEDYTYIRGRGRGRYVCSECGIRCKKPSMLKKHIRTHTDVRPYTCKHCNFSFKTKGNLTKHMQSKTHYKKCIELGINPGPMPADGEFLEPDMEFDQQSSTSAGGRTSSIPGESDSDDFSDNETESSDTDDTKSRLQEHEAARCLLSLSMTPPIGQSISPQLKSDVYTYQHSSIIESSAMNFAAQPTPSPSPANTTTSPHPGAIKRVVSFTSPKPPFDYQKQEQYYSNPEESKPKRSANASSTSFESSPIDLTKPRPSTTEAAAAAAKPSGSLSAHKEVLPNPSPMHTQAQIRDVIFGATTNESGFLKTLISMSDKVRTSAEGVENSKKINESILLQAYLTEQALQYTKIKQCQMSRSFLDGSSSGPSGSSSWTSTNTMAGVSTTTPSAIRATTPIWGGGGAAGSSTNTSVVVVASNSTSTSTATMVSTASATTVITAKETVTGGLVEGSANQAVVRKHLEPSRIQEPTYDEVPELKVEPVKAAPKAASIQPPAPAVVITPSKSSDESEESECPSDQEPSSTATMKATLATSNHAPATKPSTNSSSAKEPSVSASASSTASALTSSHNANLPAAVQNPGTTDFSGVLSAPARTVIVGEDGFKKSSNNEILPVYPRVPISSDGRPVCTICSKIFQKQHQLVLHMNIHYMERKFKCESCGVSFRTQGHLQKHERSEAHKNKVMMTSTFGVPTTSNPRPFECTDCKIAFRIHGHLAKHLRSKTHVQKLECLQKLPFGTYAEIERAGISLTEIDTSDCENSLISLKHLAQKLIEKDPSKLSSYTTPSGMNAMGDANSNAGLASHDSASEDGFSAAANAAATAIASLDNDSATNTPRRGNSMSEDEALGAMGPTGGLNSLKRRLPSGVLSGSGFSNGEESDNQLEAEKRPRVDSLVAASPAASSTSNASN